MIALVVTNCTDLTRGHTHICCFVTLFTGTTSCLSQLILRALAGNAVDASCHTDSVYDLTSSALGATSSRVLVGVLALRT